MITQVERLEPLYDYILVEPCEDDTITESGLVLITHVDKNNQALAKVIAVGPGRIGVPGTDPCVDVGDMVLIGKMVGIETVVNGKHYRLIKAYDAHCRVHFKDDK